MRPRFEVRSWRRFAVGLAFVGGNPAWARAPITEQTVEVRMWGLDGEQHEAAFVAALPDGARVKPTTLSPGNYRFEAMPPKLMLWVEADEFGRARHELTLPPGDIVHVDVVHVDPGTVEFLVDLGPDAKRMSGSSPFGSKAPLNDGRNAAPTLGLPSLTAGTTVGATLDEGLPEGDVPVTTPGVWYVVPGDGTTITASTCGSGSDFDTKISVYCDGPESALVAGNDDAGCAGPLHSSVSWCSVPGRDYHVLVHGFGGQVGRFELSIEAGDGPCEGGNVCISGDPVGIGASCLPTGECVNNTSSTQCQASGGTYQGDGTNCGGSFSVTLGLSECPLEDISQTGSEGPAGDDESDSVPIGFDFVFFNNTYDELLMSTNGYLTFGPFGEEFDNVPCGNSAEPNALVAPLWDDFVVSGVPGNGTTHYETVGVAPNRRIIAQWTNVEEFEEDSRATFQAVLFELDGCVEFRYYLLDGVPSFPGDCTLGLERENGLNAFCVGEVLLVEGRCLSLCYEFVPPLECECVVIDFTTDDSFDSPLANGEIVSPDVNGLFGDLLRFHAYGAGVDGACIYDTDPNGPNMDAGDPDLLVDTGNALICQATDFPQQSVPGFYDWPNDNPTGGNLVIEFTDPWGVEPKSIDLIDVDPSDTGPPMQLFLRDMHGDCRVYAIPGGFTEDLEHDGPPGYRTLYLDTLAPQPGFQETAFGQNCSTWFDEEHVVSIEIIGHRSYAIDNLVFCRGLSDSDIPE